MKKKISLILKAIAGIDFIILYFATGMDLFDASFLDFKGNIPTLMFIIFILSLGIAIYLDSRK